MSTEVWITIITALLGLLTAGFLALVNSWVGTRAGIDENLRTQRLDVYPALWKATAVVSRWPRTDVTRGELTLLHKALRAWYFDTGGLFLSESARARYGDVQKLVAALLEHKGDPTEVLIPDRYTDLMETASALRTALTEDLDTRKRKSLRETRRRSRWHDTAESQAKETISLAKQAASPFQPALTPPVASAQRPPLGGARRRWRGVRRTRR